MASSCALCVVVVALLSVSQCSRLGSTVLHCSCVRVAGGQWSVVVVRLPQPLLCDPLRTCKWWCRGAGHATAGCPLALVVCSVALSLWWA